MTSGTANSWRGFEVWALAGEEAHAVALVFLAEMGMEVGGGFVVGPRELAAPLHEETVGQAAHHGEEKHDVGVADAAAVFVMGDIQTLMKTTLDAPCLSVEVEPLLGVE